MEEVFVIFKGKLEEHGRTKVAADAEKARLALLRAGFDARVESEFHETSYRKKAG